MNLPVSIMMFLIIKILCLGWRKWLRNPGSRP